MSILIKGMEVPKTCGECPVRRFDGYCSLAKQTMRSDISWCDYIKEVPTPHGRLIDADTMTKEIKRWKDHPNKYIRNRNKDFIFYLNNAETVIEAEVKE